MRPDEAGIGVRELRRTVHDPDVEIVVGSDDETPAEVFESVRERQRVAPVLDEHGPLRRWRARSKRSTAVRSSPERSMRRPPTPDHGANAASRSMGSGSTRASATDLENMHRIDERVSIGLNDGTDMVERILRAVATG